MAATRRDSPGQTHHTSPEQKRYRSSSFSSDIPIPSSPSLYGGGELEYRAPYGVVGSSSGRPSMSHSASLPTVLMAADEDPLGGSSSRRSSLSSTYGENSTPKKQKSTYNHPYLIHSSSSAVLSRTNTSPSVSYTALPPSTPGHRASKSMGFLRGSQSSDDLRSPEKEDDSRIPGQTDRNQDGRSGYTSSYTPPVRRKLVNRCSVSNLSDLSQRDESDHLTDKVNGKATGRLDLSVWQWKTGAKAETTLTAELPPNPKAWNAHETAQYVAHCLSNGLNPNPNSATVIMKLPPPVIQDITGWIKRGRITGKAFLAGGDSSWSSSPKPPPFLDVLLSLSRNLRRASLKGSIAGINWSPGDNEPKAGNHNTGAHGRDTSVLEEAENEEEDNEAEDCHVAGNVKRLAHDFDTRSTGSMSTAGSEIAEEDSTDRRPPRSTRGFSGSSRLSQGRSAFHQGNADEETKRFEQGLELINKQPTESVGAKFGRLVDTVHSESYSPAWDQAVAQGGLSPIKNLGQNVLVNSETTRSGNLERGPPLQNDAPPIGLGIFQHSPTKSKGQVTVEVDKMSPVSSFTSPPPAYTSTRFPDRHGTTLAEHGEVGMGPADVSIVADRLRADHPQDASQSTFDLVDAPSDHESARPSPYGQLHGGPGGRSIRQPRLPAAGLLGTGGTKGSLKAKAHSGDNSEADDEDSRDTARRVTIRPGRKVSITPGLATPARLASPARSASVTPGRDRLSQTPAPELIHELGSLKADLAAAHSKILELERQLQDKALTNAPVPAADRSGPLSNHQSLAMLYGGLTGLCVSILVMKFIGRRGLL